MSEHRAEHRIVAVPQARRLTATAVGLGLVLAVIPSTTAGAVDGITAGETVGTVVNGEPLLDTNGKAVQAHGGGFLRQKVDPETNKPAPDGVDTYFWVGEDKSSNSATGNPVHLYKSTDLTHWEDLGTILDFASEDQGGNRPLNHNKIERPKLLFNEKTGRYVLWAHYETASSYTASEVIVATSATVAGPYTIEGGADGTSVHFRPGAGDNRVEAFGNRYGSAVRDWDSSITSKVEGASDINTSQPVVPEYPYNAKLYTKSPTVATEAGETITVDDGKGGTIDVPTKTVTSVEPKTQPFGDSSVANSYGSTGWAWSFELDNITNDTTVKAATVRMTDYDPTFYDLYQEAAASVGVAKQNTEQLVRYPAKAGTAGAEPATVSGPSDENDLDASATVASTYDIVDSGADTFADLAAPELHPSVEEKANADDDTVLVNPKDMVFITAAMKGGQVWYTTDGSEPEIDGATSDRYYQNAGQHITVSDLVEPGDQLTVKVKSFNDGEASETSSVTYQLATEAEREDVPLFEPVFSSPGGKYTSIGYKHINLYSPTFGAEVYYTADGVDPKDVLKVKGDNVGYGSRDLTVYQDPKTGKAYLITAQDHIYVRVWELNDDYTDVDATKQYDTYVGKHREAPAPVRVDDYVYLFTSSQSGWQPNQGQYARTTDIANGFTSPRNLDGITTPADFLKRENFDGPQGNGAYPKSVPDADQPSLGHRNGESAWSELQPFGDNTNYRSQPTRIFDLGTPEDPEYLFFGDRWNPSALGKSSYTFYPLEIDNEAEGPGGEQGGATLRYEPEVTISRDTKGTLRVAEPYRTNLARQDGVKVTSSTPGETGDTSETYDPRVVIDGEDWDVDNYDDVEPFFRGTSGNYWLSLELPKPAKLDWVGFSSRLIGGSEGSHKYEILASRDGESWDRLVDATDNTDYGFNADEVSGVYQHVRLHITGNSKGDWASGVYEFGVYGEAFDPNVAPAQVAVDRGQAIFDEKSAAYTFDSLLALREAIDDGKALIDSGNTSARNVAEAADAVHVAIEALVPRKGNVKMADKHDLIDEYEQGTARNASDYTPQSWKSYAESLETARTVIVDPDINQRHVTKTLEALTRIEGHLEPS